MRIKFAEPTVAIAIAINGSVFFPEQGKCHPLAAKLLVQIRPVRLRIRTPYIANRARKQKPFKIAVTQIIRHRP